MRRRGIGGDTDDISITEEKEIGTLSQLMDDESTTDHGNTEKVPISDDCASHTTIFLFPAIMEIREQRAKVVTIGPYHHKEKMLFGHDYKWQVVDVMTYAFQLDTTMFFRNMVRRETELRGCYEEEDEYSYPMETKDFLQMLLLDGCFILFALRCLSSKNRPSPDMIELFIRKLQRLEGLLMYQLINNLKILVSSLEMHQESVICDLLQMENQIPFFVLQELLCICHGLTDFVGSSIEDLALSCFKHVHPKMNKEKSESPEDFLHLLDVFHWSRVPKDKYKIDNRIKSQVLPGFHMLHAADFHSSGMKFKKNSVSSLDVEIKSSSCRKSHVIKIPTIDIKNYQFSVFESLVTFEVRYKKRGFCFTAFIECIASLLGSEKDVKLLQKSGIIPTGTEATDDYMIKFFHQLNRCINPVALMPDPYDGYKNAVDHVRETVEISQVTEARCWFRF
jgi:Plant protein of unknown function